MSIAFLAATPEVAAALQQLRSVASVGATVGSGGALGGASLVGAGAAVIFMAGDSPPKPMPVSPNPFEGISRFMIRASDAIAVVTAHPAAAVPAVGLPEDVSPTTSAAVDPLDRLAVALQAWDGAGPLEIGGFVFERLPNADGMSVVKITIATDTISDIIRVAQEVRDAFSYNTHVITVETDSDKLGENLLRWGQRYHDDLFAEFKGQQERLLAMNDKLKRGEPLSDDDNALLRAIIRKIQDQKSAMAVDVDILKELLYKTDKKTTQVFHGVMHDLNPRLGYLQVFDIPVSQLEMGKPLGENELALLDKFNQVTLDYAVRYAIALAKLDLKADFMNVAVNVGGLDIDLVNQEEFELLVDILTNLVSNAVRYSDPKKGRRTITVSARRVGDGLEIEVADNGIGIPADKLKDLGRFEFRVKEKAVEGSQGKGLWHVLKRLKELGWGDLWIKSTHGEGSTMRFVVPDQALRYSHTDLLPGTPVLGRGFYKLGSHHE